MKHSDYLEITAADILASPEIIATFGHADSDPEIHFPAKSPVAELGLLSIKMLRLLRAGDKKREIPKWRVWARYSGADLERHLEISISRREIDLVLGRFDETNVAVLDFIRDLRSQTQGLRLQIDDLKQVIERGKMLVEKLPDGADDTGSAPIALLPEKLLGSSRERLEQRVVILNGLLVSLEQSLSQAGLVEQQAHAVLDRWTEIVTRVIPLWKQKQGLEAAAKNLSEASPERSAFESIDEFVKKGA